MEALFPFALILLGTGLAACTWFRGGLPRTAADRALERLLSADHRAALDLTLSFAVIALGICAFA